MRSGGTGRGCRRRLWGCWGTVLCQGNRWITHEYCTTHAIAARQIWDGPIHDRYANGTRREQCLTATDGRRQQNLTPNKGASLSPSYSPTVRVKLILPRQSIPDAKCCQLANYIPTLYTHTHTYRILMYFPAASRTLLFVPVVLYLCRASAFVPSIIQLELC